MSRLLNHVKFRCIFREPISLNLGDVLDKDLAFALLDFVKDHPFRFSFL